MKTDTAAKNFMGDNRIFADLFNQYIFGGRQVLLPEQLEERDSAEISLPYGSTGASVPVQKLRDVKKLYTAKTDGRANYVLFGVESQTMVHYAMPVRNSLYDALAYAKQAEEAAKSYERGRKKAREKKKARKEKQTEPEGSRSRETAAAGEGKIKLTSEEFLSGFRKEDRLIPVVTLTIWLGPGEWDGPLRLFDMLEETDPAILAYMNDYRMNLTAPGMMTDEEIMQYQTGLREVMFFIKYSKDRGRLQKIMETDKERFEQLERPAADVIEAVTGTSLYEEDEYEEEEEMETVNVCQAIREMQQEAYDQGRQSERDNTLREKERADAAEQELRRLREENQMHKENKYEEEEEIETVNVCQAIREMQQEAYDQGRQSERDNTLREKERADAAEQELRRLREENRADAAEQELRRLREEVQMLRSRLAMEN